MANTIDWLNATGAFLVRDDPGTYETLGEAVAELDEVMEMLREDEESDYETLSFGNYWMVRIKADGVEEFMLNKKLSALVVDENLMVTKGYTCDNRFVKDLPDISMFFEEE